MTGDSKLYGNPTVTTERGADGEDGRQGHARGGEEQVLLALRRMDLSRFRTRFLWE